MSRKITAIVILALGFVISVSIISSGSEEGSALRESPVESEGAVESRLDFTIGDRGIQIPKPSNAGPTQVRSGNLTDLLTQSYISRMLNNETGFISSPEDLNMGDLEKMISEIDQESFSPGRFTLNDVDISNDNSKEAQIAYIESIYSSLDDLFGNFEGGDVQSIVDKSITGTDQRPINFMIQTIPIFMNELLQMRAPSDLGQLHINMLNILQKELTIYSSVADFNSDPMKAYITITWIPEFIEEGFAIKSILDNLYQRLTS